MWTVVLLIIACLWALVAAIPSPDPAPLWGPEQVGGKHPQSLIDQFNHFDSQ